MTATKQEMNQLLQDIPIRLILDDEEIETEETDLLAAATGPSTAKRGGATQAVASQRRNATNGDGPGGKEQRHDSGHPCQGLPTVTNNKARNEVQNFHGKNFLLHLGLGQKSKNLYNCLIKCL